MKKYNSLGELLIDFRKENDLSQSDFAAQMNVDVRTVQRWEKDETLIKPEKEKALADDTLLPYHVSTMICRTQSGLRIEFTNFRNKFDRLSPKKTLLF